MENQTAPPLVETIGDPNYPIWLLGDSPSAKYLHLKPPEPDHLTPLDPRHPTRHTIWTPILHVIQRHLFSRCGHQIDDSELFIRNAVSHPDHKLKRTKMLEAEIAELQERQIAEIAELRGLLKEHKPLLVLCFGQFAYACALRTQMDVIEKLRPQDWKIWGIPELRIEFDKRIKEVQLDSLTLLPLLHASTALSFQDASRDFSRGGGNYFEYVGEEIANVLIDNHTDHRLDKLWLRAKRKGTVSE